MMCSSTLCFGPLATVFLACGVVAAPRKQEFLLDIPRVREVELRSNMTLRTGLHAYVLIDKPKWEIEDWKMKNYTANIPYEWVDFYTNNLDDAGKKPHLYKLKEAAVHYQRKGANPRYMQLRLSSKGWKEIRKAMLPKPLPDIFWD